MRWSCTSRTTKTPYLMEKGRLLVTYNVSLDMDWKVWGPTVMAYRQYIITMCTSTPMLCKGDEYRLGSHMLRAFAFGVLQC
jgi:hypothetical protein